MKSEKAQSEFLIILGFLFIAALIILTILFLVNLGVKKECRMEAEIMNAEWKYNFWIDCMIKVDDRWIRMSNYIINKEDITK